MGRYGLKYGLKNRNKNMKLSKYLMMQVMDLLWNLNADCGIRRDESNIFFSPLENKNRNTSIKYKISILY